MHTYHPYYAHIVYGKYMETMVKKTIIWIQNKIPFSLLILIGLENKNENDIKLFSFVLWFNEFANKNNSA